MTVAEMMQRMSSREYETWKLKWRKDPFGPWREDFRLANVMCQLCNLILQAWFSEKAKPFKIADFMPDFGRSAKPKAKVTRPPPIDPRRVKAMFRGLANQMARRAGGRRRALPKKG